MAITTVEVFPFIKTKRIVSNEIKQLFVSYLHLLQL